MNPEEKARQLINHINLDQFFSTNDTPVPRAHSWDDRSIAQTSDQAAAAVHQTLVECLRPRVDGASAI